MTPRLDKLVAVMRRDLLTAMRYHTGLWVRLSVLLVEISGAYYLARAIGPSYQPEGVGYFPFLLVGTSMCTFFILGITAFVQTVYEAQQTGTMEVLLTTSTSGAEVILLAAASTFSARCLELAIYLFLGFALFGVGLVHPDWVAATIVFLLSLVVAVAMGLIAAAFQILVQKGMAMAWLLGTFAWLATGSMFPVSALPRWLQIIAPLIPITHSLNGLRIALLRPESASMVGPLVGLSIFAVILLPTSIYGLSRALRIARLHGMLSFY